MKKNEAYQQRQNSTDRSITVFLLGTLVLLASSFVFYDIQVSQAEEQILQDLSRVAQVSARVIDVNLFDEVFRDTRGRCRLSEKEIASNSKRVAKRRVLLDQLMAVRLAFPEYSIGQDNLYIFCVSRGNNKTVFWALMTHANPFTGETYTVNMTMRKILEGASSPQITGVYLSPASHDYWVSAYAALRAKGEVIGVVDATLPVGRYIAKAKKQARASVLPVAGAEIFLLFVFLVVRFFYQRAQEEKKIRELELARTEYERNHDALTRLWNRRGFMERLRQVPSGEFEALILLNIDRFFRINHEYGHDFGDIVLSEFGRRMGDLFGTNNAARLEGNTFAGILTGPDFETLKGVIYDKIENLKAALVARGVSVSLPVHIGAIPLPGELHRNAADLLQAGMLALKQSYGVKEELHFVEGGKLAKLYSEAALENDFPAAFRKKQFEVFYHPIIPLEKGPEGAEALIRWRHPERGLIPPNEFIRLAENTGWITRITLHILELICEDMKRFGWSHPISINLSAEDLWQANFFAEFMSVVQRHGVSPATIKVEVTEGIFMQPTGQPVETLQKFRETGISVSLDDFGTGYSSLQYLLDLPVDYLKIDRSFLLKFPAERKHYSLIRIVSDLARDLGLKTIAEGVERAEQLEALRNLGVHYAQGYYFAKPLSAENFDFFLQEREKMIKK